MQKKRDYIVLSLMLMIMVGCSQGVDPNRSIEQVRQEALEMSKKESETKAQQYAKAIRKKKVELEHFKEELKNMSFNDLFDRKKDEVQTRMQRLISEASNLTLHYSAYANRYRELGGDMKKIEI